MSALVPCCPSELTPEDSFTQEQQQHSLSALLSSRGCSLSPVNTTSEFISVGSAQKQREMYLESLLCPIYIAGLLHPSPHKPNQALKYAGLLWGSQVHLRSPMAHHISHLASVKGWYLQHIWPGTQPAAPFPSIQPLPTTGGGRGERMALWKSSASK